MRPGVDVLEDRRVLSTLTVLNNLDSGKGSLRAEIKAANSGDTIVFDSSLAGKTIFLTSGELLLNKDLTITGPGAGSLAISGSNLSRVFEVASAVTASVSGLTISNGSAVNGGGFLNAHPDDQRQHPDRQLRKGEVEPLLQRRGSHRQQR